MDAGKTDENFVDRQDGSNADRNDPALAPEQCLTDDEKAFFTNMGKGGIGFTGDAAHESKAGEHAVNANDPDIDFDEMAEELVNTYFMSGAEAYAQLIDSHRRQLSVACAMSDRLRKIVLIGLRMGVEAGDRDCAYELGVLYEKGIIVSQDYGKAASLFGIAASKGMVQAILELGHLYDGGSLGEADHAKAFSYFAFAAAATQSPEALCKMGDAYYAGNGAVHNSSAAYTLWNQAVAKAHELDDAIAEGHAAMKVADVLMDEGQCAEIGIPQDFLAALSLYQTAEIGFRLSVSVGNKADSERLEEAVEGQAAARAKLGSASS